MRRSGWLVIGAGLLVAAFFAGVLSYYASSSPDGLERVAADHGFAETATDHAGASIPTADYAISGVADERMSVGLAGLLGVVVMAILGFGLFWLLTRGRTPAPTHSEPTVDA